MRRRTMFPASNMKLLLSIVGLAVAVSAEFAPAEWPLWEDYHVEVGIPEADRIRKAEESMDFDGGRIVGGSLSSLGQHPHLVGIVVALPNNRQSFCGSTLLSNTRLLTAAHCWRHGNTIAIQLTAVLGSLRIFSGGTRITSRNVQMHANYNQNNLNNDIAIVVISHVGFTNAINRINLASGTGNFVGVWAVASGFGRTSNDQQIGQNQPLRHVSMQVITNAVCANSYGTSVIIGSVICTATNGGRTTTCGGDSGGPLDTGTGANRQLIGVTSFVHRAGCTSGHPAGFMRVTSFNAWIRQRM